MSFILDALKKSESDRQRQSGPALFEVRVAPPRTRLPTWAIAIALLLVLNLGVVLWMLLRHQGHAATDTVSTAAAAGAASTAPPASVPTTSAPMAAGSAPPVPVVPVSSVGTGAAAPPASTGAPSGPPAASAATAPSAPSATPGAEPGNAEDYAPAQDPSTPAPALGSHVRRGTDSGIPLYQDLTSTPGTQLPQLRLDLHVFAAHPQERFVMVNMHKLREGDTLPEGVRVDSITPEGAVMSYNGTKFLLPRD